MSTAESQSNAHYSTSAHNRTGFIVLLPGVDAQSVPPQSLGDVLFRTYSRESLSPQTLAAAPTGARRVMQFSTRKVKHLHCENPENQVVFSPYDAAMVTDT